MKKLSAVVCIIMLLGAIVLNGCSTSGGASDWDVKIGEPFPDFTLQDTKGQTISKASLLGKPYVMSIFGTWCPPCKEELLALETTVWQSVKESDAKVIAVNFGDEDAGTIQKFMDQNQLTFPALVDSEGSLRKKLGVKMVPQCAVVGADGIILDLHVGYTEESISAIKEELQKNTK